MEVNKRSGGFGAGMWVDFLGCASRTRDWSARRIHFDMRRERRVLGSEDGTACYEVVICSE